MLSFFGLFKNKNLSASASRTSSGSFSLLKSEAGLADTRAAIDELSQVVKDNPEAVEIYLALGNLYRSQGEFDRAAQIRNSLIVRPGLDDTLKARTLYELGRDFMRGGFLDRAENAFDKAREIVGDSPEIIRELAGLAAGVREFEKAAQFYSTLRMPLQEAHYLARAAEDEFKESQSKGFRTVKKALKVASGSIEAWLLLLSELKKEANLKEFSKRFPEALNHVPLDLRFTLVEGLLTGAPSSCGNSAIGTDLVTESDRAFYKVMLEALEATSDIDVTLCYYGARLLHLCGEEKEARLWLEKTLVLNQNFWLARLELFRHAKEEQTLTPFFSNQLDFFVNVACEVKRFTCSGCGLKGDRLFFVCPKCHSWYSITFRKELNQ
jgi:tetratricopeptide (TPR) repeat protein